jgi:hypothetical protein
MNKYILTAILMMGILLSGCNAKDIVKSLVEKAYKVTVNVENVVIKSSTEEFVITVKMLDTPLRLLKSTLGYVETKIKDQKVWAMCYVAPYEPTMTFDAIVRKQGIDTVAPNSYHFGKDGHSFFNRFMLQYIITNKFISFKIPIITIPKSRKTRNKFLFIFTLFI